MPEKEHESETQLLPVYDDYTISESKVVHPPDPDTAPTLKQRDHSLPLALTDNDEAALDIVRHMIHLERTDLL